MSDSNFNSNIRKRLLINSASMGGCRMLMAIVSMTTAPLVISRLGIAGYGTWEAIIAVVSLSAIFTGTINSTLVWKMSSAYGAEDMGEIKRLVRIGVTVTLALFLIFFPLAWVVRLQLVDLLNIPVQFKEAAQTIFPWLVGMMILGGINETLGAVIGGVQRASALSLSMAIGHLINYSIVIAGILTGWGLWSLPAGFSTGLIIVGILNYRAARTVCGALSLLPALPHRSDIRSMSRYSSMMMIGIISVSLRDQADKVILALFSSPVWVGYYGIASRLAGLVMEISRYFYISFQSAIGALNARNDWKSIQRLYSDAMTTVSFAAGAIIVLVAGLYDRLLILWLGRYVPEVPLFIFLLLMGNAVSVMFTSTGAALCRGLGRAGMETTYLVLNLIANLILTVALVMWMGPVGTVVSSAVTWTLSSFVFVCLLHHKLDLPMKAIRRAGLTALIALAAVGCARLILHGSPLPPNRMDALFSALTVGSAAAALYTAMMIAAGVLPFYAVLKVGRRLLKKPQAAAS